MPNTESSFFHHVSPPLPAALVDRGIGGVLVVKDSSKPAVWAKAAIRLECYGAFLGAGLDDDQTRTTSASF
jgi:hypothetical protein